MLWVWGDGGCGGWVSSKMRTGEWAVTPHVYVRTYTTYFPSFHVFGSIFEYSVLFYMQNFNLTFIQKRRVCQKRLVFSNKINFCRHEISFSYIKLFLLSKVLAKALLILIKWNLRYNLYLSTMLYFEKTLWSVTQR